MDVDYFYNIIQFYIYILYLWTGISHNMWLLFVEDDFCHAFIPNFQSLLPVSLSVYSNTSLWSLFRIVWSIFHSSALCRTDAYSTRCNWCNQILLKSLNRLTLNLWLVLLFRVDFLFSIDVVLNVKNRLRNDE